MDEMDMESMDILTGSNPTIQPDCNMLGKGVLPGLRYRHLGKSGLKVSNIGLGSLKAFTSEDCEINEELVTLAFEAGINLFDISEPFTSKRAEVELGRIIKKNGWARRQFVVSTKVYWDKTEGKALSRKEIIESVGDSLKNLQLDYIDLLIIHKNDPNCPIEEILRALNYLINTGKVGSINHICDISLYFIFILPPPFSFLLILVLLLLQVMYWGTAKWSPVEIFETFSMARTLNCVAPLCEYAEYHPFHREKVELYMAELYNKIGIGLMTWSPISLGLCSSKPEDQAALFTKLALKSGKYNKGGGIDMLNLNDGRAPSEATARVKHLEAIADKERVSLSQLVLAWSLRNNTSQTVIVSASSVDQLCLLFNSLQLLPKLTNALMEEIDKVLSNKPTRPPMVSTLQARWAATGGLPPQ